MKKKKINKRVVSAFEFYNGEVGAGYYLRPRGKIQYPQFALIPKRVY